MTHFLAVAADLFISKHYVTACKLL